MNNILRTPPRTPVAEKSIEKASTVSTSLKDKALAAHAQTEVTCPEDASSDVAGLPEVTDMDVIPESGKKRRLIFSPGASDAMGRSNVKRVFEETDYSLLISEMNDESVSVLNNRIKDWSNVIRTKLEAKLSNDEFDKIDAILNAIVSVGEILSDRLIYNSDNNDNVLIWKNKFKDYRNKCDNLQARCVYLENRLKDSQFDDKIKHGESRNAFSKGCSSAVFPHVVNNDSVGEASPSEIEDSFLPPVYRPPIQGVRKILSREKETSNYKINHKNKALYLNKNKDNSKISDNKGSVKNPSVKNVNSDSRYDPDMGVSCGNVDEVMAVFVDRLVESVATVVGGMKSLLGSSGPRMESGEAAALDSQLGDNSVKSGKKCKVSGNNAKEHVGIRYSDSFYEDSVNRVAYNKQFPSLKNRNIHLPRFDQNRLVDTTSMESLIHSEDGSETQIKSKSYNKANYNYKDYNRITKGRNTSVGSLHLGDNFLSDNKEIRVGVNRRSQNSKSQTKAKVMEVSADLSDSEFPVYIGEHNYYRNRNQMSKRDLALKNLKKNLPKTAVVSVECGGENSGFSYADVLKHARKNITLESLGITDTKIKRAQSGAMIIEVLGDDVNNKADSLRAKLTETLESFNVNISRPMKNVTLRVLGLDDSVTKKELENVLAKEGNCQREHMICLGIKAGRDRLGWARVRCPAAAALKILEQPKVRVGWTFIKIILEDNKPLQCYKCLALGHTYHRCPSNTDRRNCCLKCGMSGHFIKECKNEVQCPVCSEKGLPANHRVGDYGCLRVPPKSPTTRKNNKNNNKNNDKTNDKSTALISLSLSNNSVTSQ